MTSLFRPPFRIPFPMTSLFQMPLLTRPLPIMPLPMPLLIMLPPTRLLPKSPLPTTSLFQIPLPTTSLFHILLLARIAPLFIELMPLIPKPAFPRITSFPMLSPYSLYFREVCLLGNLLAKTLLRPGALKDLPCTGHNDGCLSDGDEASKKNECCLHFCVSGSCVDAKWKTERE